MSSRQMVAPPRRANYEAAEQAGRAVEVFDPDAWHVMNARDDALIADELMHGAMSRRFVYEFDIPGSGKVAGVSVVGARHLANAYGGIKHRLVSATQKVGELFTFTSFAAAGQPMTMSCALLPELADEPDFYSVVVEVTDVKTGNSLQVEKRESRVGVKRGGGTFEREHYATIAQSKAFRNGVLAIIPQDIVEAWKMQMLQLGEKETLTGSLIDQKREGVLTFSASKAIPVDRMKVYALGMSQIAGLAEAARAGIDDFRAAAEALGVLRLHVVDDREVERLAAPKAEARGPAKAPPPKSEPPKAEPAKAAADQPGQSPRASAQPARPAARTASPEPAAAAPQPDPAPEQGGEFEAYLVDAFGEVVDDAFEDPARFAAELERLYETTFPTDRAALLAANEEAMLLAAELDEQAAAILNGLTSSVAGATAAAPAVEIVAVPEERGRPSWTAWNKLARAAVADLDAGAITAWIEAHAELIASAPAAMRPLIVKMLRERCAALDIAPPEALSKALIAAAAPARVAQGNAPPEEGPPLNDPSADGSAAPSPDRRWADGIKRDLAACATRDAVNGLARNAAVRAKMLSLKEHNRPLFNELEAAFDARLAELAPGVQ